MAIFKRGGYTDRMKVLVPDYLHASLVGPAREAAPTAELLPYSENDAPVAGLEDAEAVLRWAGGKRFAQIIEDAPKLRWLHTASAGVDHVLTPAVRANSALVLTDSGPAYEIAIGEFVLAWMLMAAHGLTALADNQRAHVWRGAAQFELHGKTVGIIGLGPIGRGVAARCKAFGMQTVGLRRQDKPVDNVDDVRMGPDGLETLLAESDFVVIAAALTGESRALMGADALARMKPSAWLINIARGGLVDEPALIEALQTHAIAGACLDVFAREPLPPESLLWDLPNVHIAPHNSSGGGAEIEARLQAIFLDNLGRFERGEPLENVVDKEQGY